MTDTVKAIFDRIRKAKMQRRRLTAVICVLSVLISSGVMMHLRLSGSAIETQSLTPILQTPSSSSQITSPGGEALSQDGKVKVSKTIAGTALENIFDITLTVQTSTNIKEYSEKLDMAVMIVLDVSHTMKDPFGNSTRAAAAIDSANKFIDRFAANTSSVSRLGVVLFNTSSIYPSSLQLQQCSTPAQAAALKEAIAANVNATVHSDNYGKSHERFTNIESGIKQAKDKLNRLSNQNKFIIFLSDGFPTTYIKTGSDYEGWDPYCESGEPGDDGVFYDCVKNGYCTLGTSYSDKAAVRAHEEADRAKGDGITIFSIGIDIGGQTIAAYANNETYCLVDRDDESYEIGAADSAQDYKDWLKSDIGSGYYYDSTDPSGLEAAYESIFAEIQRLWAESAQAVWVANDPMPQQIEFIGFFDKSGNLKSNPAALAGENAVAAENTAAFNSNASAISWNLKSSGYAVSTIDTKSTYSYSLVYRVRLKNELSAFVESQPYNTNSTTTLSYQLMESIDGSVIISEVREVDFPIPAVKGYLVDLSFTKLGGADEASLSPLAGATFTLTHNTAACSVCRGDSTPVSIAPVTATSDENGSISFTRIPSGHIYTLEETVIPVGHWTNGDTYTATAAYDELSVGVTNDDGTTSYWEDDNNTIINFTGYQLPNTGGPGASAFMSTGLLLMLTSLAAKMKLHRK